MASEYTALQRAAFSFTAAVKADAPWRDIDVERLSFTEPGQDPASQMFPSIDDLLPSIDVAMRKLYIRPGDHAGLGFMAFGEDDARELEDAWKFLLAPPARRQSADHRRPSLRKDPS